MIRPATPRDARLHALKNTIDAMGLRVYVLAADPSCMQAQGDNIRALERIVQQARRQAGALGERSTRSPARPPSKAKVTPR